MFGSSQLVIAAVSDEEGRRGFNVQPAGRSQIDFPIRFGDALGK